jgi:hypothetical protein
MELHLKISGVIMIALALVHVIFPKYFDWENDLKPLSLINRQLMYVHTFFIAFLLLLIGVLSLTSAQDIVETDLGKRVALGIAIFWFVRLIFQFFGYSSKLWKGKTFETAVHIFFTFIWTYFSVIFFAIYWS